MVNYRLQAIILEVVDEQLKINEPKCTKEAFNNLISLGYKDKEAKKMIASVLLEEMYDVMKNNQPFDDKRYCSKLSKLLLSLRRC